MDTENNTQPNIETQSKPNKPNKPQKSRRMTYLIIAALAILAVAYYVVSQQQVNQKTLDLSPSEVERLPEDEKASALELQLKDLEQREKRLNSESDRGDRFSVYIQLAEVRTSLGKHEEALQALDKIQGENTGNTRLWATYATVYKNMGKLQDARVRIQEAIKIDPEIVGNWLIYLDVISDLTRTEQDAIYMDALKNTTNNPEVVAKYEAFKAQAQ